MVVGSRSSEPYDAIVLGGGHNGLVAAAYLARAGLRALVLERRRVLGGATLSEEPFPGFRFSVFSYLVSLLRPEVIHELDLVRHGLWVQPLECTLNPLPGGDDIFREADPQRTFRNLARHSLRDAEAYPEFKLEMTRLAHLVHRLQATLPAEIVGRELTDGKEACGDADAVGLLSDLAHHFNAAPRQQVVLLLQMLSMSAADLVERWFEHDGLRAAISTSSIIGSAVSPRSPGSAYVLLHHYMGEIDGAYRGWGFQRGGTGQIAQTIARAARAFGAELRTGATVASVLVEGGRAVGVELDSGEVLRARAVLSSLAPQTTFLRLLSEALLPAGFRRQIAGWSSAGCSAKVNLALSGLPRFASRPDPGPHLAGGISIAPSLDVVERAFDDFKAGRFSRRPFVDLVLPSVLDRDMAPPGRHVMSCFVQYAPYRLAEGTWDNQRESLGDAVVDTLAEHIPNLRDLIVHRQVMTPLDIERVVGIPGANIFHGELSLAQLFLNRPAPGAGSYRTPVSGYYVCGSSTHPGGGISGSPGRLGALTCLQDLAADPGPRGSSTTGAPR